MEEKKCNNCNQLKKINEFKPKYCYKLKKYYLKNNCEICEKLKRQKYYKENREKIKERWRIYYLNNKEKRRLYFKKYLEKNKEVIKEKKRIYHQKEEVKQKRRIRENKRRKEDFYWKLKCNLKRRLRESLNRKKYSKNCKTFDIIGISYDGFFKHIESKFYNNMNWHNKDKWHIDHIIPLKATNTEFEVIALNHYTNLQPLWAKDNFIKGDSYNKEDFDNYMNWYVKNVRTKEEYNSLTL